MWKVVPHPSLMDAPEERFWDSLVRPVDEAHWPVC